ncbi:hypothetical protein RhiJN_25154 [Ceratobasidium sp. AG-Ba]|nr:hypothetical protein RhiJN_25154 [Ceratobasidium sp. AG-Ba]
MKFSIFSLFAMAAVSVLAAPIPGSAAPALAVRDVIGAARNSLVARDGLIPSAAEPQTNDLSKAKKEGKKGGKDKKKDGKGNKKNGKGKKEDGKGKKKDGKGKKEAKPKTGTN